MTAAVAGVGDQAVTGGVSGVGTRCNRRRGRPAVTAVAGLGDRL